MRAVANLREQVERLVQEFDVGFVQGEHDVLGHGVRRSGRGLRGVTPVPVGLLGLATKTTRVFGRDGGQHGVEVVAVVLGRHDHQLRRRTGR